MLKNCFEMVKLNGLHAQQSGRLRATLSDIAEILLKYKSVLIPLAS